MRICLAGTGSETATWPLALGDPGGTELWAGSAMAGSGGLAAILDQRQGRDFRNGSNSAIELRDRRGGTCSDS